MQTKVKENVSKINAYELQTALLRGGVKELKLKQNESLVLLYLCSCYNGSIIYPHIKTISENVGISETTTKRALKELTLKGCILKSKRHKGNNSNEYLLTNKVLNLCTEKTQKQRENSTQKDTFKVSNRDNKSIKMTLTCNKSNNEKLNNLSNEDKKLIQNYIEKNSKIENKKAYFDKVIKSNCTLLLKRLKEEINIQKRAENEQIRTQKLLEQYRLDRINSEREIPQFVRDTIKKIREKNRK